MYCYIFAAPRLACVRPVASVHPEPGSNSSLYIFIFSFSLFIKTNSKSFFFSLARVKLDVTRTYVFNISCDISRSVLIVSLLLFQWSLVVHSSVSRLRLQRYCFFQYLQIFFKHFFNYFLNNFSNISLSIDYKDKNLHIFSLVLRANTTNSPI